MLTVPAHEKPTSLKKETIILSCVKINNLKSSESAYCLSIVLMAIKLFLRHSTGFGLYYIELQYFKNMFALPHFTKFLKNKFKTTCWPLKREGL